MIHRGPAVGIITSCSMVGGWSPCGANVMKRDGGGVSSCET